MNSTDCRLLFTSAFVRKANFVCCVVRLYTMFYNEQLLYSVLFDIRNYFIEIAAAGENCVNEIESVFAV